MIDALTYILIAITLAQPSWHRVQVVSIFASMTLFLNGFVVNTFFATDSAGNTVLYTYSEALAYYGSDAAGYILVISLIASLPKVTKFTIKTIQLCLIAFVLDVFGWISWMTSIPIEIYNYSFMLLYAWAIIALLRGDAVNGGISEMGGRYRTFHAHAHPGHFINHHRKETKWHPK